MCNYLTVIFFALLCAGGFATLTKSAGNIVVWSDFSRESATIALSVANNYAIILPPLQLNSKSQEKSPIGASSTTNLSPSEKRLQLLKDFIQVVETFDNSITHLEVNYCDNFAVALCFLFFCAIYTIVLFKYFFYRNFAICGILLMLVSL